jgi:hypothetical protein
MNLIIACTTFVSEYVLFLFKYLQSYQIESSAVKNTFKFVKANAFFFCCNR